MKSLSGNEIGPERVFVARPSDLGTITNAYSNLFLNSPSTKKTGLRLPLRLAAITAGVLFGYALGHFSHAKVDARFCYMLLGGLAGLLSIKFSYTKQYYNIFIGTKGIAEYKIDNVEVKAELLKSFLFENALFLVTHKVHFFTNNSYQHTAYLFEWYDKEGEMIFIM